MLLQEFTRYSLARLLDYGEVLCAKSLNVTGPEESRYFKEAKVKIGERISG
jgi:hypothetical protein